MTQLWNSILKLKIWSDSRGQDMIEYALTAGLFVLAAVAFSPELGSSIISIFGKITLALQGNGGGSGAPTT